MSVGSSIPKKPIDMISLNEIQQALHISGVQVVPVSGDYTHLLPTIKNFEEYTDFVNQIIALQSQNRKDVKEKFHNILTCMHRNLFSEQIQGSDVFNAGVLAKNPKFAMLRIQSHTNTLRNENVITITYGVEDNKLFLYICPGDLLEQKYNKKHSSFEQNQENIHGSGSGSYFSSTPFDIHTTLYGACLELGNDNALLTYVSDTFCFKNISKMKQASEFIMYNIVSEYLYTLWVNTNRTSDLRTFYTYDSFITQTNVPYVVQYNVVTQPPRSRSIPISSPVGMHTLNMHFDCHKSEFNLCLLVQKLEGELNDFYTRMSDNKRMNVIPNQELQSDPSILNRLGIAFETILYLHHHPNSFRHVSNSEVARLTILYTKTYAHFGLFEVKFDETDSVSEKLRKILKANRDLGEKSLTNSFILTVSNIYPNSKGPPYRFPPNTFVGTFVMKSTGSDLIETFRNNIKQYYNNLNEFGSYADELPIGIDNIYLYYSVVKYDASDRVLNDTYLLDQNVDFSINEYDNSDLLFEEYNVRLDEDGDDFSEFFESHNVYSTVIDYILSKTTTP
jgi:hypothetical protein